MVAHGSFGNRSSHHVEATKCKVVYKAKGDDHYISTILFINLKIKFENQAPGIRPVCESNARRIDIPGIL
jgi:hypothetical protein